MEYVIIGVDPHKLSATLEVVDHQEKLLPQRDAVIAGNLIADNQQHATPEQADGGWGIGVGIDGGSGNRFVRNRVEHNANAGLVITATADIPPDGNEIEDNTVAANGLAAHAFMTTNTATAAAALGWMFTEWSSRGKPTALGAASGAVAGLVAITPAAGFVTPMASIVIGVETRRAGGVSGRRKLTRRIARARRTSKAGWDPSSGGCRSSARRRPGYGCR